MKATFVTTSLMLLQVALSQDTKETHSCIADKQECNYTTHYYDWLACDCLALFMCEIGCVSGKQLDPRQTCGDCLTDEEYNAIFPSWVTP